MTRRKVDPDGMEADKADLLKTRHIDLILGRRLRDQREAMGLGREAIAETLDVSVTRIQNYEDGHRIPASRLWQFCARYGIEVETLFIGLAHHVGRASNTAESSASGVAEEQAPFARPSADAVLAAIEAAAAELNPVERSMALAALRGMSVRKFKKP